MEKIIHKSSLRDTLLGDVSKFLESEGFRALDLYSEGLLL